MVSKTWLLLLLPPVFQLLPVILILGSPHAKKKNPSFGSLGGFKKWKELNMSLLCCGNYRVATVTNSLSYHSSAQRMHRTRSQTQATLPLHPNEEIAHALHCLQPLPSPLLDKKELERHDHGRHPDCQFTSFIHETKRTLSALEDIIRVRTVIGTSLTYRFQRRFGWFTWTFHTFLTTSPLQRSWKLHIVFLLPTREVQPEIRQGPVEPTSDRLYGSD